MLMRGTFQLIVVLGSPRGIPPAFLPTCYKVRFAKCAGYIFGR